MTDHTAGGVHARRRAEEAGARARQLRDHVDAVRAGTESLHGSTVQQLALAVERARHASERLALSLEASADAHDRAADTYHALIRRHGDPDGSRAGRAAVHREDAGRDRLLAAEVRGLQ
jgi:hypothetical protein